MNFIFLSMLVGAGIGLFTNWLAILMLFRPWTEKKWFGKRIPFTPGLIPSRQGELAEKLGDIVQEDLLTPEGVAKSLHRHALEFAIKRATTNAIRHRLHESPTLGQVLDHLFGTRAQAEIEAFFVQRTVGYLQNEEARGKLEEWVDPLFDHLRETLANETLRHDLVGVSVGPLHQQLTTSTKLWKQVLPESARDLIEDRLCEQVVPLLEGLSDWMEAPEVVDVIARMLTEKVENIPLIGSMAKSFLTPERVAADIVPRLQAAVQSESVQSLAVDKLQSLLHGFWEQPVGRALGKVTSEDLQGFLGTMLQTLLDRFFQDSDATRASFRSLVVGGVLAGVNERNIGELWHRLLHEVMRFDLHALYLEQEESVDRLLSRIWTYARDRMVHSMPDLLETLSVRQIVRDQVASYPIQTLEKLIRHVVNKELRVITYLGGVLGALIGLVQGLLAHH